MYNFNHLHVMCASSENNKDIHNTFNCIAAYVAELASVHFPIR